MACRHSKIICLATLFVLMVSVLSGCGSKNEGKVTEKQVQVTAVPTVNPTVVGFTKALETEAPVITEVPAVSGLDSAQLKAINTLNYLTSLLQDIHESKQNRIYLQEAFVSLKDNTHPDIDSTTQSYVTDMLNTLSNLRMLAVKRDHLEYIYEQKKAQALKSAIPSPLSVLNIVQAGNPVKMLASLAYMAADSVGGYLAATSDNDLQYLQDGWELDEQETKQLDQSQIKAFNYMVDIVRDAGLHDENALLAMNETSVKEFIGIKNTGNVHSRIRALKDNEKTYRGYGGYWLLLAQSYYELGQYEDCLKAFASYESLNMNIFRKDHDYANTIPLIVSAASESMTVNEYIPFADKYLGLLMANCENSEWNLRYFAAVTYLDLYRKTTSEEYLQKAFYIAKNNVNYLIKEQLDSNEAYLVKVKKEETTNLKEKDKKEAEQVNKAREEKRKKELPPVYEPLWINCNLMFDIAQKYDVPAAEKSEVEAIMHNNDNPLFLIEPLDDACWFERKDHRAEASEGIDYNKGDLSIPAKYISDDYNIVVKLTEGYATVTFDDWIIDKVERKTEGNLDTFIAKFKSKKAASHDYKNDGRAKVSICPKNESDVPAFSADFKAVPEVLVFQYGLHFERVGK